MNRRLLTFTVIFLVFIAGALWYVTSRPPTFYGVVITPPKPMPDFTLHSSTSPVTFSDYKGKYVFLYFGYTSCPDLCPTTLATLSRIVKNLDADKAKQVQVIFVSVDYLRDTPERTSAYAKNFSPDFIGLGGSEEEIAKVTKEYGIYYKLNTPDPETGFYSVDHSASVLVFDRQGDLVMTWPYGMDIIQMESDLRALMKRK